MTTPAKFADAPIRMLRFEGVTVRSDALATIHLVRDAAMTANDTARARGGSAGSASNTLRRMVAVGVLEAVELPPSRSKFANRLAALTGYRCTEKGKRLLDAAGLLLDELEEQDPEATWPRPNTETLVRHAMQTAPRSVFDLGRAPANDPHMVNSVFALGR